METLFESDDIVFMYVTFASTDEATKVGQAAVEARLAACANITASHTSIYRWKEKIEINPETAALFKTTKTCSEELASFIRSRHSYETPCIATIDPSRLNKDFSDWVRSETKSTLE